jgi:hypothetical protein
MFVCLTVGNFKSTYDSDEEAFLIKVVTPVYKGIQYIISLFQISLLVYYIQTESHF